MSRIVIALFSFLLLVPQGLRAAAQLTQAYMSKQVPDMNSCSAPPATAFSTTDQAAYLVFAVSGVNVGDVIEADYYASGTKYAPVKWDPETQAGNYCYALELDIAGYTPATMPGTWTVYILNNGSQIGPPVTFTIASAATCTYSLSSTSASVAAAGGSGSFSVTLGSGCTASVSSDSWITFTISGTTVNYTVQPNTGTSSRVGHITVGPQGSSVGAQTFTITQAGASGGGSTATGNFNFPGFTSTAGLTLVGNAATASTSDGTVLRLTPATSWQSSAAYSTTPVTLGNNATFNTQFQFRFTSPGGSDPADGITFVLGTSATGLGGAGVGIGYQGVGGNSVAIEFDTYNNGSGDGNSSNHVAIDTGGNLANTNLTNVYGKATCDFSSGNPNTAAGCMSNGDLWTVNINYDGSKLTVTLSDPKEGSSFTAISSYPINLASILGQTTAYVGFTSGTGSGWENHDIVSWIFANTAQSGGTGISYDPAASFATSPPANPSGVWSYGYETKLGSGFTLYRYVDSTGISGITAWEYAQGPFGQNTVLPAVAKNTTASTISSGNIQVPTNVLLLHPGPSDQYSIVRFTAPAAGSYSISGSFSGLDSVGPTTTDVHILQNGSTSLFSNNVSAFGAGPAFSVTPTLNAGDTIDFAVGYGSNNNYNNDSTGLKATITQGGGTTGTSVYYRFENGTAGATATGSGSIVDSMGNQNGTPSGTVTYSSDVPLSTVGGAANKLSLQFATNGSVQFPGAFPLNSLTNATVEFYVKPTGTGSQMFFLWTRTDSTDANRFNMGVINGNSIGFDYREPNGTWHIIFPGGGPLQIPSTGWSHVAVVKSGNVWTGYINGVQMGQPVTDANPNLPTNTGWTLNGSNLGQFAGLIDELRISNSALTPSQFLPPVSGGAGSCTYSLSTSSASVAAGGGSGSFTVTTGAGCTVSASSDVTWITPAVSQTTVNYTVQANTSTSSRIGHITVNGQTFTVTQAAAAACSYSISPSSNSMTAQGGSSSVSIALTAGSGCSWTASVSASASSWLHLGSTTSGTGSSGSVTYTADANTSTVSRTGTIAIANQTFTLTQAGGASVTAPSINQGGIVNAVSNRGGGGIAQGSMFTIYGSNLGPAASWTVSQFPIPSTVNNVTVTVTQGSTNMPAYLLYVQANQINAIMPSNAPLGNAQITVTYNGIIGASAAVTIVKVAFGINSANYGSGPGIIKNYDGSNNPPLNTASTPAKPGQVEIVVGTGLGPITTPDNQSPPAGAPTTPVQVLVGGIQANVAYSGRAPGNAGQDQINFTVPANAPLACSVPVQISAGGIWSNPVLMAISSDGKHCQDTFNPYSGLSSTGGKSGTLGLVRMNFSGQTDPTKPPTTGTFDLGFGAFTQTKAGGDTAFSPITNLSPPGTCSSLNQMLDLGTLMSNAAGIDPTIAASLDAGAQLTVTGGAGGATGTMTQSLGSASPYVGLLGAILNISGATVPPPFLDGGPFTISGPGGKDVGKFSATIALTPAITWINPPSTINRASPLTLTWTGGDSSQTVMILGGSSDQTSKATGGFLCFAPAGAHSFTVPLNSLADLIPTGGAATSSSGPVGFLSLMPTYLGSVQTFTAPGLDVGVMFNTIMTVRSVQVQ